MSVVAEVLRSGTDPDILEAQRILLLRLALEGDIVQSRMPAPRNITEIGGYVNLLATLQQPELSAQMLSGILGVAGPNPPPAGWVPDRLSNSRAFRTIGPQAPHSQPFRPWSPCAVIWPHPSWLRKSS